MSLEIMVFCSYFLLIIMLIIFIYDLDTACGFELILTFSPPWLTFDIDLLGNIQVCFRGYNDLN